MEKIKKKMIGSAILLAGSVLLYLLALKVTGFASWYAENIYTKISVVFAWICNWVPFSVTEFLIYALLIAIVYGIVRMVLNRKKEGKKYLEIASGAAVNLLLGLSIFLFLYVINCGINYQGIGFAQKQGLIVSQYTREELISVCMMLTEQINGLEDKMSTDENGNVVIPEDSKELAIREMKALGERYGSLKGYYPKPKELVVSEILSYQSISGIYSPITVEANYNGDMPDYMQPFTMCHELSHLKGVMREEEANFVAYLACMNSEVAEFQYSGAMMAYYYCMSELRNYDAEAFVTIRADLCETANTDILLKHAFWAKYEGVISTLSTKVNDAYLKANSQAAGVDSYNEVVGLILALYREK